MADKQAYTADETIVGLLAALQVYANRAYDPVGDWDGDGDQMCAGAKAREALAKYGVIAETLSPQKTKVDVGDVLIHQLGRTHRTIEVQIDGKRMDYLKSIQVSVDSDGVLVHLERVVGPRLSKV